MKELRELLAKGTQGKWYVRHYTVYTNTGEGMIYRVADVNTSADPDLIAAMHNALPELLDAQEKWSALMFARQQGCETCPMNVEGDRTADNCGMCDVSLFDCLPQWQKAWRDAHADTKAD